MRKFVIKIPVADLRREKAVIEKQDYSHQDIRETQLLFGENIELIEESAGGLKVQALEQLRFDETQGWHPYQGWVHDSEVREVDCFVAPTHVVCAPFATVGELVFSYGTLLSTSIHDSSIRRLPAKPNRAIIVEEARRFLGAPYLWGGRAFPFAGLLNLKYPITSVDCSALINLLYRAQGVVIPRNAHAQYLKSRPTSHLKAGDPLYLAREKKINHVILKLDNTTFIESPETGKSVRLLTWGEEIWESGGKIHIFDRPHSYTPYPCTFVT